MSGLPNFGTAKPISKICRSGRFEGLPPRCPADPMYIYPVTSVDVYTQDHELTANSVVEFLEDVIEDCDITVKQDKFKLAMDVYDAWGQMASVCVLMFFLSEEEMRFCFRCDQGSRDVFLDVYERCRAHLMGEATPSTSAELLDSMPPLDMEGVDMPTVEDLSFEVDMVEDTNESVKCEALSVLCDCGDVGAQAVLSRKGVMSKVLADEATCVVIAACRLLGQCESNEVTIKLLIDEEVAPSLLEGLLAAEPLSAKANKLADALVEVLRLSGDLVAQCDIHSLADASDIFVADNRVCRSLDQCLGIFPEWHKPKANPLGDMGLKVHNSLTDTKVPFIPINGKEVRMYVCGPTVYDSAHMGHARAYLTFDIIRRILEDYFQYRVFYQMNITDIDDKIILKARKAELVRQYSSSHHSLEKVKADCGFVVERNVQKAHQKLAEMKAENIDPSSREYEEHATLVAQQEMKVGQAEDLKAKFDALSASPSADGQRFIDLCRDLLADWLDEQFGATIEDKEIFYAHARWA
ncbi:hypothetical protein FOZ63_006553, partial [Perkinsus olseni]